MLNSLLPDHFEKWVLKKVKERRNKVENVNNMMIEITPELHKAFKQSNVLGTKPGRGGHMMKATYARRKTKEEKKEIER